MKIYHHNAKVTEGFCTVIENRGGQGLRRRVIMTGMESGHGSRTYQEKCHMDLIMNLFMRYMHRKTLRGQRRYSRRGNYLSLL